MRKTVLCLVVLAAMSLVAGCDSGGKSALEGTEWVLTSLNGNPLLEDTQITLKFENEILSGFAGCNGYGGGPDSGCYTATKKGALTIPVVAITVQECPSPQGVMEQEKAYVAALTSSETYRVVDDRLEIQDADGETVLVYARQ